MEDQTKHCALCKKPLKDLEETICAECDDDEYYEN